MTIRYLDDGNDVGTVLGQTTTAKIGFYGLATPIVRPLITAVVTGTATTSLNKAKINRLYVALRALGIVSTATAN
jgi:hypothetical protein